MNDVALYSVPDIERMATAIAKSGLFGLKTPEQAIALCLVAQAEGKHPALAARDYDIIQGRPAKKPEAMLRDFIAQGGKVKWHALDDTNADATFTHPQGGEVRVSWDMERAKTAGLAAKDNWKKYPRPMLRARVISEGVRTVCPSATSGVYTPEEVQDFDNGPVIDNEPIKQSLFKNASLRNSWCKGVIEQIEKAKTRDEVLDILEQWKAKCEELKANGNEHDVLAVESIRTNADIVLKRHKSLPREGSAADIAVMRGMPIEENDEDEPASHSATSLPNGEVMPGFLAKGR